MATVEDVLTAFPEDIEQESSSAETPSANVETTSSPSAEDDRCFLAVKAAMETIGEFCDTEGLPVDIAGTTVRFSPAVLEIARMDLDIPREDRIRAIRDSAWLKNLSNGLCTGIRGFTAGTPEHEKCVATLIERMTEELVK